MCLRRCSYHFASAPLLFAKVLKKSKKETDVGQDILGFVQILNNSSLGYKTVVHRY